MNEYTYVIKVDLDEAVYFLWNEGGLNEYVDMLMSIVTESVYDGLRDAINDYLGEGEDDE